MRRRGSQPSRRGACFVTGTVVALLQAAPGFTQESEAIGVVGATTIETVQVTATRRRERVFDVPTAVTVIGEDALLDATPQVLPEMFRGEVGTFFQQTTPGQGTPIIRGLKGSQILHLVDGMRLNNAFFRNAPTQYVALVDALNVERMEVVRGPAATLYGGDAMGGVVHILTPEPVFDSKDWRTRARAHAAVASAELSEVLRGRVETGRQGLGLSAGYTFQSYDDRRIGGGDRIGPADYVSRAADLKLIAGIGKDSDLMLGVQYLRQPSTPRVDELLPGFGQDTPAAEEFFFEPNERLFYHGRYAWRPGGRAVDELTIHVGRQTVVDDRRIREFGAAERTIEENESELTGATLQLDSTIGSNANLVYGVEFYDDQVSSSRERQDIATGMVEATVGRFPDGASIESLAVYLDGDINLSPAWSIDAGLRFSDYDIALPESAGNAAVALEPDDLTGHVSVKYVLSPQVHLGLNLGRGFRPPNIFDLGTLGPRPGNRFNIANSDLGPESVTTLDVGVKLASRRWQAEAFVFRSDYDDQIASVPTGEVTADGRIVVRSENISEAKLYGLEAGVRYFSQGSVEYYGVVNWVRGEERLAGGSAQPGDRIPPLNGKVGARYLAAENFELEPFALYAGEQDRLSQRDAGDPRIDPDGTPGWVTLNLRMSWQLSDKLRLGLLLENLTDKRFREHGSGLDARGFNAALSVTAGL